MNRESIRILMLLLVAMSLGIGEAKATTVDNVKYIDHAQWYCLDGHMLDNALKAKGVYINKGEKYVVR